jgi:hypothetical protein
MPGTLSPEIEARCGKEWWDNLTEAQKQAEITAVRTSVEDIKAGRIKPLSQVVAEARTKHNFPESWLSHL